MPPEFAPLRVVIADDDEGYAELVADLLHGRPELEVIGIAKDGEEAVQLACWQDADLVLMDVDMPRIDGIVATRLVREARPRMCVLMLSGADPDRIEEARLAGATGYVNKLHALEDLIPALLAICAVPAGGAGCSSS
jgi:DNA-binding NarL/FixJ family response regulator